MRQQQEALQEENVYLQARITQLVKQVDQSQRSVDQTADQSWMSVYSSTDSLAGGGAMSYGGGAQYSSYGGFHSPSTSPVSDDGGLMSPINDLDELHAKVGVQLHFYVFDFA